uniref:DUF4708 domain-containing protein n=1 Tax=Panagrellus redivivus TaxID=6233 RepID=A0A7E4W5A4_PANRE
MGKDKHKTNRVMKMKPGKSIASYMDLPTSTNYMATTSTYPCGPKENMTYSKCTAQLANILDTLNYIHESKKPGANPLEPWVKTQYQRIVVELRETVNRGAMPSTIEYIVNRLIRDLNNFVDKDSTDTYTFSTKLGEWYNVKRRVLLKTCATNLVVNAFETHGLMVQVVRVLNKLMALPQYQRSVSIKRQLNPYYRGIEIAYNVANASIPKCSLDNDSTPSGLVRRTGPDVVSSSNKTADLPRPDMGPKICPLQVDVVSLWKLFSIPFDYSEFSATTEFFEDLNLARFATRLRDGLGKVKYELTYVATNNSAISTRQLEVSKKLAQFHVSEAKNMSNDAKWFLSTQRQKKDQSAATLQAQQKEMARLQEDYVKIEKDIERQFNIIKEVGVVPLVSTRARYSTFHKKMLDAEKEVNKLREMIRRHEESITSMEAAFEEAVTNAIKQLSDTEKEKAEAIKRCGFEKKLNKEIKENSESAESCLTAQKRVKGVDAFATRHLRSRKALLRKMRHAKAQIDNFTASLTVEADPLRREILSTTLAQWENTVQRLKKAETEGDEEFRKLSDDILSGTLSIEDALKMKPVEVELPKRTHQLDLPEPVGDVNLPSPIAPPKGAAAAPAKRTRFPIEADASYEGLPPIGVIPYNYIKKSNSAWYPPSVEYNPSVKESTSSVSIGSQSSTSSYFSTISNSIFAQAPPPVDQSYQGSYYRSIVRPHLGPSMAKQFAKLQAQRRLPVPF